MAIFYLSRSLGSAYSRISTQRAYFDILRDIAQFDKRNSHLESIIRFSKFEFEEEYNKPFKKINPIEIENYIKIRLHEL